MSTRDVLQEPPPRVSGARAAALLAEGWGLVDCRLSPLPSERDLNLLVDDGFVLKVSNPAEPDAVVDMEVDAMAHAAAADPSLAIPRIVRTLDGRSSLVVGDELGRECRARLVTVLPGSPLEGADITAGLAEQIGAAAARTSLALQGFFHPAADRVLDWDPRRLVPVLTAAEAAGVVTRADDSRFFEIAERVAPSLAATGRLRAGVQHADVTLTNVLADGQQVTGIIDFGDMHHTAVVCDAAITLAAVLRHSGPRVGDRDAPDTWGLDTWGLAGAVLRGYQRHRLLEPEEVDLLGDLLLARLSLTALISRTRAREHADNLAYITQYDESTTRLLDELTSLVPAELTHRLHRLAGTSRAPRSGASTRAAPEVAARRAAVMGGPLSPLFYRTPLHIERGEGPWLFTSDGRRLLDAYNNVAVVGHAHPTVTQSVARQLAVLNTHSRYLHPGVVELAERIVATMPPGLDTCLFTTSGTEANELAWRMATELTGGDGALTVRFAYHGSTKWTADLSPNEWPPGHAPDAVARFEAPYGPAELLTRAEAAARVRRAAGELAGRGRRPALVLADSGFTSEGVRDAPDSYLQGLVAGSHEAGALFLADEVQIGYGRTGPQLWRFQVAGITPDFVSLGKPMGAGYPIGALVTRREIADVLAQRYEYFSTFAASPVAAAAGNAVLDVLEAEALPQRALAVGANLRTALAQLRTAHPALGDIRGSGLLAGVDLLAESGEDHRAFARDVLDALVEAGVLAGLTGPGGNVLKVRPPLAWETIHADLFCERLDEVLTALRC